MGWDGRRENVQQSHLWASAFIISAFVTACDLGLPEDDCVSGDKWCHGDNLMICGTEGHDVIVHNAGELLFACGEYGGYCGVQDGKAGCVVDQTPCADGVNSLCIGNYLCECSPGELPVLADSQCTTVNTFCAESGTIEGSAYCAASSDPCTENGLHGCFEDDGGVFEVHACEHGVWVFGERCVEPNTSCVEFADGGADCQQ
jgi:hypothetical protein